MPVYDHYRAHHVHVTSANINFLCQVVQFDFGMKDKDPITNMRFYRKDNPEKAVPVKRNQVSQACRKQI